MIPKRECELQFSRSLSSPPQSMRLKKIGPLARAMFLSVTVPKYKAPTNQILKLNQQQMV